MTVGICFCPDCFFLFFLSLCQKKNSCGKLSLESSHPYLILIRVLLIRKEGEEYHYSKRLAAMGSYLVFLFWLKEEAESGHATTKKKTKKKKTKLSKYSHS